MRKIKSSSFTACNEKLIFRKKKSPDVSSTSVCMAKLQSMLLRLLKNSNRCKWIYFYGRLLIHRFFSLSFDMTSCQQRERGKCLNFNDKHTKRKDKEVLLLEKILDVEKEIYMTETMTTSICLQVNDKK